MYKTNCNAKSAPDFLPEIYCNILESLPHHPHDKPDDNWHGFWANGDNEIMCPTEEAANLIADFFEDCGFDIMHTHHYTTLEELVNEDYLGWWSVYIDGQ